MRKVTCVAGVILAAGAAQAPTAFAQSSVTLYGVLDTYVGYQSAEVGGKSTHLVVLGSNGLSTSRIGFKGVEDLGGGYAAKFDLEGGFDPSTGAQQNSYRSFDRQAWVSIASPYGELRMGRQESAMWYYSGNLDAFGAATYASGYNNFAQWLARVDNDIAYFAPKFYNTEVEIHYALGGQPGNFAGNSVFQAGVQSNQGPLYLAAAYLQAANAGNTTRVKQLMAGGNYDYGHGKLYLGFFRTNDVISATTGNALVSPGGKFDPTVGAVGNTAGEYHNTYSVSADFRINPAATVAAGYAYIHDSSTLHNNAEQFSLMATYSLSKRTTLYADVTRINNDNTAQFKMGDAATTTGTFLTPDKGKDQTGAQIGIRHLF
jgi:predicted porin